jgi:hypothetical protein
MRTLFQRFRPTPFQRLRPKDVRDVEVTTEDLEWEKALDDYMRKENKKP